MYRLELHSSRHAIEQVEHQLAWQIEVEHDYYTDRVEAMWAQMEEMYAQHNGFEQDLQEFRMKSEMSKTWSAQASELHIFHADHENRQKDGHRFYKMDDNNIQML